MNHNYEIICLSALLGLFGTAAVAQDNTGFDACRKAVGEVTQDPIVKMKFKNKKGVEYYKIKAKSADGAKWEFKCDKTGNIFEKEQELPSADHPAFAALKKVDEAQARKIALEAYPGTISEVEYEINSDGFAVYEFEIKMADGREMEVEVDAGTGKIIKAKED